MFVLSIMDCCFIICSKMDDIFCLIFVAPQSNFFFFFVSPVWTQISFTVQTLVALDQLVLRGLLVNKGLEEDVFIGDSLIQFYAECGDLDYAWKVFDEMLERNTVLGTSSDLRLWLEGYDKGSFFLVFRDGGCRD
ncbi:putative pentatricopeptide [Rosa chinensis]|uniref:Putative pentatricopeptide n=1 Tax=Rosa chinensis TaxID=74649 RepID=A0A2P6QP75_ROSCH|nr:putative pentatricopeptide [Rosa chinensis]